MPEEIRTGNHDLVARVATLELIVADLIDLLWRLAPAEMERLALEADHDADIQNNRIPLPAGEHQRMRLANVLQDRRRKLQHRRRARSEAG